MVSLRSTLVPRVSVIFTIRENFRKIYNPSHTLFCQMGVQNLKVGQCPVFQRPPLFLPRTATDRTPTNLVGCVGVVWPLTITFVAFLLLNVPVKKSETRVNIWCSYDVSKFGGLLFVPLDTFKRLAAAVEGMTFASRTKAPQTLSPGHTPPPLLDKHVGY